MAEQELDGADVGAGFEQVNGEAVSQRVGREGFGQMGQALGFVAGQDYRLGGEGAVRVRPPGRATGDCRDGGFASNRAGQPATGARA